MCTLFDESPHFETERWLYHIPLKEDMIDFFPCSLDEGKAALCIQEYHNAFINHQDVVIGAYLKEDRKLKCIFEIYRIKGEACTIGYRCHHREMNKHYTSSALKALLKYIENNGLKTIHAGCSCDNIGSRCILEHNGFKLISDNGTERWYLIQI